MKRLTQTLAFCLLTVFTAVAQKNYVSEVWVSDLGNGKYKNPVLYADYSDPDACRVGDDFYMTSSSFNCLPGLQILHSKDLVNWTIIGAAVPNALPPIETPERPEHGNRVWAPAIRPQNLLWIFLLLMDILLNTLVENMRGQKRERRSQI